MKHGSLFSGFGGFDLAAHWMGWENVFHCEWNPFAQQLLKYYWNNAISYEDITKTDFSIHHGTIDIISGGFPCQPFSNAGKRKGTDDPRYLWDEMLRAIRQIAPRYVVGENVYGIVSWDAGMVFDKVCADLENEGFEVTPVVLPAVGINAPHKRERIFFVAHAKHDRHPGNGGTDSQKDCLPEEYWQGLCSGQFNGADFQPIDAADSKGSRSGGISDQSKTTRSRKSNELLGSKCGISNDERDASDSNKFSGNNKSNSRSDTTIIEQKRQEGQRLCTGECNGRNCKINEPITDSDLSGRRESHQEDERRPSEQLDGSSVFRNDTDSNINRLERGVFTGSNGQQGRNRPVSTAAERIPQSWDALQGYRWENFPTEPPVCGADDGISHRLDNIAFSKWRNESLKGFGNAVVPQLAFMVFKAIQMTEEKWDSQT